MGSVHSIRLQAPLEKCYEVSCKELTFRRCVLCGRPCCPAHKNPNDTDYCLDCRPGAGSAADPEALNVAPLVGPDGVAHEGRVLKPVDGYVTFCGYVHEMPDEMLDRSIEEYAREVHEAQAALDKKRVRLTVAQSERSDRSAQRGIYRTRQPAVVVNDPATGQRVKLVGAADNAKQRAAQVLRKFEEAGIDADKLMEMIKNIISKRK